MTKPQKKALAALAVLRNESGDHYYRRTTINQTANHSCQGYPTKTMRALEALGFVENDSEDIVQAVVSFRCRCGCDRWRITPAGLSEVSKMNLRFPKAMSS